jgi:hypothetical protein
VAKILKAFDIQSPEHGRSFEVHLVEGLDPAHLDFIKTSWSPVLASRRNLAILGYHSLPAVQQDFDAWTRKLGMHGAADAHWLWDQKCAAAPAANRKVYGLLNGADVEAAMLLKFGETCRLDGADEPLVYVDYVSTAPWNRGQIQSPPRFNGLGTILVGAAVAISLAEGLEGRCGLHSLASAEGFYRRIGMSDLGVDAAKNLRYFEYSASAGKKFIEGDRK